jgi:hypothetical protein
MTQAKESQLLLQTTDILQRLSAENLILSQAADLIAEQLINMNVISSEEKDLIRGK